MSTLLKSLDTNALCDAFIEVFATLPKSPFDIENDVITEILGRLQRPESIYHAMRRMFYVDDHFHKIHYAEEGVYAGHKEWMESKYEKHVRGYACIGNIYFYAGGDEHRGGEDVERVARAYAGAVASEVGLVNPVVHVGVEVGIPGDQWDPLETIGRVREL